MKTKPEFNPMGLRLIPFFVLCLSAGLIVALVGLYKAFFYPVETGKLTEKLIAIKDKDANFYLYKTDASYICFDTGYGSAHICGALRDLSILPEDIKHVFLTHTDHDHAKGLKLFPDCGVSFHKGEMALVAGKVKRIPPFYANPPINRECTLLEDNERITIDGTTITVIATKGHTPGHVAYLVEPDILITGDSIVMRNEKIKPFYRLFNMNQKQAKESARKLLEISRGKLMCSAHTGFFRMG
jgi:glyoxylase-like metal-dependent hydrolase (beta-lactamase superfamily II)